MQIVASTELQFLCWVKSPNARGVEMVQGPDYNLLHRLYNNGREIKYLGIFNFSKNILVPLYRKPVPREA